MRCTVCGSAFAPNDPVLETFRMHHTLAGMIRDGFAHADHYRRDEEA